ncbi:cell division cycle 2-like [Apostasia shenzhenica]|uniref:Cell division cycle 2-like n=1 Tax=Apostasia shenzhenica TaxID=1088818 RepID=A0A2I0A9D9_9ASPA|nr:cell division cycle 2-like [Apostasia shenzhenica]
MEITKMAFPDMVLSQHQAKIGRELVVIHQPIFHSCCRGRQYKPLCALSGLVFSIFFPFLHVAYTIGLDLLPVEVERISAHAHDKLMNKLESARHEAQVKPAEAEARRNTLHAARAAEQPENIRRAGLLLSSFSCCGWFS